MLQTGKERILILAPHADDEVLGCGGLIEKACRFGNKVKVVIAAVGCTEFWHSKQVITAHERKKELVDALNYLGCKDFQVMFDDKEALLDTVPQKELVTTIDEIVNDFMPTMVFIPYPGFHQDHRTLFYACMAGLRPTPQRQYKLVAMFEYPFIVWQYPKLGDLGEFYLDISETIDIKVEALRKHDSQIRESNHLISPDSVKSWAEKRGLEIGVKYAEKYYILKAQYL